VREAVLPITPGTPWLAPLAGWSDLPFRLLCREHGAAVCCTEMISAKGLLRERAENGRTRSGRATHDLLAGAPGDAPLVVQLFGEDSRCMGDVVRLLADAGWRYFDCNMGCAVPKVTRSGAGAALLREPERALEVAAAMLAAAAGRAAVGFKLRLGWDEGQRTGPDIAHALADMGAAWVAMHPRTARQGFSGRADWNVLRELSAGLRVPLIASGDLRLARDGVRCLRETGVDAVMYARGALSDPAIFSRHKALLAGGSAAAEEAAADDPLSLLRRIRRHAALARAFGSPRTALLKMRAAVPRYIRSLEGARKLRQGIVACRDWDDFDALLERFF
jgi:tRNA-dihydrouridine synthase B